MKAGKYHELLSKINTDLSTDEKIIKRLKDYQVNDISFQKIRPDAKTYKVSYIYNRSKNPLLRIISKVSILRRALPSLAFLSLVAILVYASVMGLYKNHADITVSSEKASDTGKSQPDNIIIATTEDTIPSEVSKTQDTTNAASEIVQSGLEATVPETISSDLNNSEATDSSVSETIDNGNADSTDASTLDTAGASTANSAAATTSAPAEAAASSSDGESANAMANTPENAHYVVTSNSAEAVNICNDYYKNVTYSEDLTIYLKLNDASKVESLFIQSLGCVDETNYTVEGNIITIKKEYLDTLPDGLYKLDIHMDKGNPAFAQFAVHPKEEESEYGFYKFSHYYWDFYLSDPKDFTFLVFNRKNASITGLRNGSVDIDPEYYELDENGYTATLYQSYMADMEEGVRFDLTVEFSDGMEKAISIKIRYKEVNSPNINPSYNIFDRSKPEDVVIKIIWNDAKYITCIDLETHFAVGLSSQDFTLENDTFTIKKEFLETLEPGEYTWYLMFDTETGADIKVQVNN